VISLAQRRKTKACRGFIISLLDSSITYLDTTLLWRQNMIETP
jgi:hypothetical protein